MKRPNWIGFNKCRPQFTLRLTATFINCRCARQASWQVSIVCSAFRTGYKNDSWTLPGSLRTETTAFGPTCLATAMSLCWPRSHVLYVHEPSGCICEYVFFARYSRVGLFSEVRQFPGKKWNKVVQRTFPISPHRTTSWPLRLIVGYSLRSMIIIVVQPTNQKIKQHMLRPDGLLS